MEEFLFSQLQNAYEKRASQDHITLKIIQSSLLTSKYPSNFVRVMPAKKVFQGVPSSANSYHHMVS